MSQPNETDAEDWVALAAAVRRLFPGCDPANLTLGQFFSLLNNVPRRSTGNAAQDWFAQNTVPGSTKTIIG